jgi:hypothetical protein
MGIDEPPEDRYGPTAGDLEGESDEAYKGPPNPEKGRIEITETKDPTKKDLWSKQWWQRP